MTGVSVTERWRSWAPYFLSLLRIVVGLLFVEMACAKLFAFPGAIVPGGGTVPLASLGGVASVLELVGGLFLLFGLFTRPVAFVLSGEMTVTVGGAPAQATAGAVVRLPGGVPHAVEAISQTRMLLVMLR